MGTFIITEHEAERAGHHFDLYLSTTDDCTNFLAWALPKGIPEVKGVKKLAVRVADHAPPQALFEGEIKEGYGKGTKSVWDEGSYTSSGPISTSKPVRLEFFGGKVFGPYYMKYWQGNNWLIWRTS